MSCVLHPIHGYFFCSGTREKRKVSPVPKYVYFLLLQSVEFLEFQEDEQYAPKTYKRYRLNRKKSNHIFMMNLTLFVILIFS